MGRKDILVIIIMSCPKLSGRYPHDKDLGAVHLTGVRTGIMRPLSQHS